MLKKIAIALGVVFYTAIALLVGNIAPKINLVSKGNVFENKDALFEKTLVNNTNAPIADNDDISLEKKVRMSLHSRDYDRPKVCAKAYNMIFNADYMIQEEYKRQFEIIRDNSIKEFYRPRVKYTFQTRSVGIDVLTIHVDEPKADSLGYNGNFLLKSNILSDYGVKDNVDRFLTLYCEDAIVLLFTFDESQLISTDLFFDNEGSD